MSRTKLRNSAMTILYQIYLYKKNNINYDLDEVINSNIEEGEDLTYLKNIILGEKNEK